MQPHFAPLLDLTQTYNLLSIATDNVQFWLRLLFDNMLISS